MTSAGAAIMTGLNIGTNVSGVMTPGAVTGTVAGEIALTGTFGDISGVTQTKDGTATFSAARNLTNLTVINRAEGVTGDIIYRVTGAGNTITLDRDYDLGKSSVTLRSEAALVINKNLTTTGNITLKSDAGVSTAAAVPANGGNPEVPAVLITANSISGSAGGAVTLNTKISNLGGFTVSGGGNFTIKNDGALAINGELKLTNVAGSAPGHVNLTTTGTGNGITVGANGSITAHGVTVTSAGAAILTGLNLTHDVDGTAAGVVTLSGAFSNFSSLQQTASGKFTAISSSSLSSLAAPNRANDVTGEVYYEVTGGATMTLAAAADFGANDVTLRSAVGLTINQNLTTTGR